MDPKKKKRLEAKGWHLGDAFEFFGIDEADAAVIDMKVGLARELQDRREKAGLSQAELAKKLKTSQPRVANMLGAKDVTIDNLIRSLIVLGTRPAEIGKMLARAVTPRRAAAR